MEVMIEWIRVAAASEVSSFLIERTFFRIMRQEETVLETWRLKERVSST